MRRTANQILSASSDSNSPERGVIVTLEAHRRESAPYGSTNTGSLLRQAGLVTFASVEDISGPHVGSPVSIPTPHNTHRFAHHGAPNDRTRRNAGRMARMPTATAAT